MKTVKEISALTGISVRTLHYYDEIGLLKPTDTTEAGYRLYDDKALESLQQILFFKEFDMPLKEIKMIMSDPCLDRNRLLGDQKNILVQKMKRLERIITSMDEILEGENKMDFAVFSEEEVEQMCRVMVGNMSEEQRSAVAEEYGSVEAFENQFLENASGEKAQKNFAKMLEWYGEKEDVMKAAGNPENSKIVEAYSKRFDQILRKLAGQIGEEVTSFEVKAIVGELDFVGKQLYQMKDMSAFMLEMAKEYRANENVGTKLDEIYGVGAALYIAEAVEAFYE